MQCIRCGKEMENTTGGNYHCPTCNMTVNDLVYRPSEWEPFPNDFGKQEGWICSVCGRGVAPWMDFCPCKSNMNIVYGNTDILSLTNNNEYANCLQKKYSA